LALPRRAVGGGRRHRHGGGRRARLADIQIAAATRKSDDQIVSIAPQAAALAVATRA